MAWPGMDLKWKQREMIDKALLQESSRFIVLKKVDVSAVQDKLKQLGDVVWEIEGQQTNAFLGAREQNQMYFKPGVKGFHLIFSDRKGEEVFEYPWWKEWKPILWPILLEVFAPYFDIEKENHFVRLQFANMKVGSAIKKHVDTGPWVQALHRVHIPIFVNDNVFFRMLDKTGTLAPLQYQAGEVFEINNAIAHNVDNLGKDDRVHLLIDFSEAPIKPKHYHYLKPGQKCSYHGSITC